MGKVFIPEAGKLGLAEMLFVGLKNEKLLEQEDISKNYTEGLKEEKEEQLDIDYDFNMEKLEYIYELSSKDVKLQEKFTSVFFYIDDLEISSMGKIQSILTYGCMLNLVSSHVEFLSLSDSFLLASSLIPLPLEDIQSYGVIISNKSVLNSEEVQ